jgi:hypothetical protein
MPDMAAKAVRHRSVFEQLFFRVRGPAEMPERTKRWQNGRKNFLLPNLV